MLYYVTDRQYCCLYRQVSWHYTISCDPMPPAVQQTCMTSMPLSLRYGFPSPAWLSLAMCVHSLWAGHCMSLLCKSPIMNMYRLLKLCKYAIRQHFMYIVLTSSLWCTFASSAALLLILWVLPQCMGGGGVSHFLKPLPKLNIPWSRYFCIKPRSKCILIKYCIIIVNHFFNFKQTHTTCKDMYIVGGGVEERPKLCVLKELVSGGFEANCVGVRRKKIRRILTTTYY